MHTPNVTRTASHSEIIARYALQRTESPGQCEHHTVCDHESHLVNPRQPYEDTFMGTITLMGISHGDQKQWQTQEYHGKQIHVCTIRRSNENEELSGHGEQWDFKVRITDSAGQQANELANAESDPGSFYSTQPVAEDLGFTRGRELVEGM